MIKEYFSKLFSSPKRIIKFALAVLIIGFTVWDCFIDSPPFWHFRQPDKKAIVEYQREHYPGAKVVDRNFPFLGNPGLVGCRVPSSMTFEYDGVEFGIIAEDGRVLADSYYEAKAEAQFDEIIIDGFMNPRGIDVECRYTFLDNNCQMSPYTGNLSVQVTVFDQGSTPREMGWLYDFYKYWKDKADFLAGYSMRIYISENGDTAYHVIFSDEEEFSNENDFYAFFKVGREP